MRVSDFGEILLISDPEDATPDAWLSPGGDASPRLMAALRRSEATLGGLAEAGWRNLGPVTR